MTIKVKVGIIGVTGYAGQQLFWLLNQHPNIALTFIASHSFSGQKMSAVYPNYAGVYDEPLISPEKALTQLEGVDVLFLALPHGLSEPYVHKALSHNVRIVDLGADFRLDSSEVYETWYKVKHAFPELNQEAVYGLPEVNRAQLKAARIVAAPGCFPTSALLGCYPLLHQQKVGPNVIIDAKSGTSGAGRSEQVELLFAEVNENFKAYGVFTHRHTPEITQELTKMAATAMNVVFTPHLLPINRGILSTIYLDLVDETLTQTAVIKLYQEFYRNEPFVRVIEGLPEIKHVKNSNLCEIGVRVDPLSKKIIVISVIDNLIKGASGQAVQAMNVMFDLDETTGLTQLSMYL